MSSPKVYYGFRPENYVYGTVNKVKVQVVEDMNMFMNHVERVAV